MLKKRTQPNDGLPMSSVLIIHACAQKMLFLVPKVCVKKAPKMEGLLQPCIGLNDIAIQIFTYLDLKDLLTVRLVSKAWNRFLDENKKLSLRFLEENVANTQRYISEFSLLPQILIKKDAPATDILCANRLLIEEIKNPSLFAFYHVCQEGIKIEGILIRNMLYCWRYIGPCVKRLFDQNIFMDSNVKLGDYLEGLYVVTFSKFVFPNLKTKQNIFLFKP